MVGTLAIAPQLRRRRLRIVSRMRIFSRLRAMLLDNNHNKHNRPKHSLTSRTATTTPIQLARDHHHKQDVGLAHTITSGKQRQQQPRATLRTPSLNIDYVRRTNILNAIRRWMKKRGDKEPKEQRSKSVHVLSVAATGDGVTPQTPKADCVRQVPPVAGSNWRNRRSRSVSFNDTVKAILIETRQQRYGDLKTKQAAFYSQTDVEAFKKSVLEAFNRKKNEGCAERDWIWQPQQSSLQRERAARDGFWREPSDKLGTLTLQSLDVETKQLSHVGAVVGGYDRWVWDSCASE